MNNIEKDERFERIVQLVKTKASIKQRIYRNTCDTFEKLKETTKSVVENLKKEAQAFDQEVLIEFTEKGQFEFQLTIGGDIILYQMHSNVFDFEQSHIIHKSAYVKEDSNRSYCGMINIYNFLADSLKYNRFDDIGYLIGRTFINMEKHFFVEGKKQLNFIHNDFVNQTIDQACLKDIVQQSIIYSMDFDLFTPPYSNVYELSVGQLLQEASGMRLKTGKRLGYKFSFELGES